MSRIAVRQATLQDGQSVYLAWQSLRDHYTSSDRRIIQAPVEAADFLTAFGELLARQTSAAFVAVEGTRLAGFVSASLERNQPDRLPERYAVINHLFVEPGHRGKGVGRALFERAAAWAGTQAGIRHVEMPVLAADTEAKQFWERVGFSPFIERLWAPIDGGIAGQ